MKKISFIIIISLMITGVLTSQTFEELSKTADSTLINRIFKDNSILWGNSKNFTSTKQFKRWEWFWGQRLQGQSSFPDAMSIKNLAEHYKVLQKTKSNLVQSVTWEKYGPFFTPESDGRRQGIGRINDIAISPEDDNILIAGASSGGAWRSTNKGQSWTEIDMTDQLNLSIADIEFSKSSPNIVYMATGDVNASFASVGPSYSVGLLKSTDTGKTFSETNLYYSLPENRLISRVLIHPSNPDIVIASTSIGIFRTTDGGNSWINVYDGVYIKDMEFHPNNPNIVYAANWGNDGSNNLYKSTDNGETWQINRTVAGAFRTEIAITPDAPDNIYLLTTIRDSSQYPFLSLLKSTDTGNSWKVLATIESAGNLLGRSDGTDLTVGQGVYDLAIGVNPKNENEIYVGGINIWKTTNNGLDWDLYTHWTGSYDRPLIHADQHQFTFTEDGKYLYVSNDGGAYRNNIENNSWEELNNGMDITEFYRLGVSQSSAFDVILGSQDNGTAQFDGENWGKAYAGDGMECIIDPVNDDRRYVSTSNGNLRRSTNGGLSFNQMINSGIIGNFYNVKENGSWVTPYILEPGNPKNIYAGYNNVWKNTNYGTVNSWSKISDFGDNTSITINSLAVSPSNPNYIYAATSNILRMTSDGGDNWFDINNTSNAITYIAVNPINPREIYVTKSGYNTNDKVLFYDGTNWKDISGNLPPVPVNTVIVENPDIHSLYVGTDIGVFYSDLNSGFWKKLEGEMPNTVVNELEIHKATGKIYAATFGRGLWRTDLLGCNANIISIKVTGELEFCEGDSVVIEAVEDQSNYLWNTGETTKKIIVKKSGNYVLTNPSSTYCSDKSDIVFVNVFPTSDNIINAGDGNVLCNGMESLRLSVPFSYKNVKWSTDQTSKFITITSPGIYTVEGENNKGCLVLDTIEIFKSILPDNLEIIKSGNSLSVADGYTYTWYLNNIRIPESDKSTIEIDSSGVYTVDIKDSLGCIFRPAEFEIMTDIKDISQNKNINIFPTITSDIISVEVGKINSAIIDLSIFNLLGELIYNQSIKSNSIRKIDLSGFAKGSYIIKITNLEEVYTNKIIIK